MQKVETPTFNERAILSILAAINFTHIMDFMIIMPLGPQLMRLFQISPREFGILVSAYTFTAGASGFLAMFWSDRFDRRKAISIVYLGFAVGTIACAFAPSYAFLLITRALTGAFGGILNAQVLSIVGDVFPAHRRGRAMGIVMASFSLASVFGVPFGLFLATQIDWHAPFLFLGGAAFIIWMMVLRVLPPLREHLNVEKKESPVETLRRVFHDKNQWVTLVFTVSLMLGHFTVIPYISPYMVANIGFSEKELTWIYLFGGAATVFTGPWIGRLVDRYTKERLAPIGILLSLVPILLVTNLPLVPMPVALIVTTLFFILMGGRMIPSMAIMTAAVTPRYRGSFMSLNSSFQQMGAGVAALISGLVIVKNDTGQLLHYNYVGYIALGFSLLALFLCRRVQSKG